MVEERGQAGEEIGDAILAVVENNDLAIWIAFPQNVSDCPGHKEPGVVGRHNASDKRHFRCERCRCRAAGALGRPFGPFLDGTAVVDPVSSEAPGVVVTIGNQDLRLGCGTAGPLIGTPLRLPIRQYRNFLRGHAAASIGCPALLGSWYSAS
jgi:hypothetical protein